MKNKYLKWICLIILLFTIGFLSSYLLNFTENKTNNKLGTKENISGLTGEGTNTISVGLYKNDKLIKEHELNDLERNNKFTLSLSNFINTSREYMMLVLVDFKQHEFKINGESKTTYSFLAKPNETENVPFSIEIPDKASELTILVIKEPNKITTNTKEIDKIITLQEVLPLRFNLNTNTQETILSTLKSLEVEKNVPIENMFISYSKQELNITLDYPNEKPLYMHIGDFENGKTPVAIVAFNNWKQTPLNGEYINFAEVSKQMKVYKVDKLDNGIIQILSFPKPFNVTTDDYISQNVYSSFRMKIK
ncbi:hypothetical protein [Peribacillus frigoritolerans]|uniref:hypothetical protein n=1 Tax=Peribacillus frigoritolerans TaxID=450367 RepID=UPI001059509B|nr:hypothetical protein [Peribacillus frigoritolerans]TDL82432.1 hypothetical protein E2R53_02320 [Peribacillus frigoritolerans]